MRTSYSALDTFRSCPRKYKFQEIDRIRVPKSKEAVFGTLVHQTLKFLHGQEPVIPTLDETVAYYQEHWPVEGKVAWLDAREETAYRADGERMIREYYGRAFPPMAGQAGPGREVRVVDVETPFEAPIEDPATGETHLLKGKIDRIDRHPDGTFEIVDYKTSRRMPSQSSVDEDLQLALYRLGLTQRWPKLSIPKVRLTLEYLRHGLSVSTSRSDAQISETKEAVLHLIGEIKTSDFRPMPGPLCDWCGYRSICPMWRHLYEKHKVEMDPETVRIKLQEFFALKKTNTDTDARLASLRGEIEAYLDARGLDRVFSDEGHVTRLKVSRTAYDSLKLREILEPLGKWEAVLAVDSAKLKHLMAELPYPVRKKIETAKVVKSEGTVVQATRAKVKL